MLSLGMALGIGVGIGPGGHAIAQPQGPVAAIERLTPAGVVADAAVEVQFAMAVLTIAVVVAAAVWGASLNTLARADARGLATALGRLRIIRSGGAMVGLVTAAYVAFCMCLGMANARPAPDLTVLAPGLAEATLALMLGLLASAVAVIFERHLEGRIRAAAA